MDIRRIKYFIEVAERLNFSKAAERLHISHQALSKQIQLLEQELGAKLMERSTTRVSLTEVGAKVYEIFKPLLRELDYGYKEVLDFIDQKRSTLRVGYFNGLSYSRMIQPVLHWLEERAPRLRISLLATDMDLVRTLLDQDSIDLAIFTSFKETERKSILYFPIYRSPLYLIVSNQHPWYQKDTISLEDLAQGNLLAYKNRPTSGDQAMLPDLQVKQRILIDNFDTYMGILRRGEAFGIVGDTYSRREGDYKLFPLPQPCRSESLVIAAYKRLHPLRHLLKALSELRLDESGTEWTPPQSG